MIGMKKDLQLSGSNSVARLSKKLRNKKMKNYEAIEELLKKHGFIQSTVPHEFKKGKSDKAVIWKSNKVTICHYTPTYGRYLYGNTYNSKLELKKELEKNHPY